jgi:hypothetical protein
MNLLKKDNRDKKDIYQNAMNSFPFDYQAASFNSVNAVREAPITEAVKQAADAGNISDMQEIDYYA